MSPDTIPRRRFRKPVLPEDLKLRRSRGEIACAECRRLKLKCDRKLPCTSCTRRGCSTICPNGSLDSLIQANKNRESLSDTSWKDERIAELIQRVQELEEALAVAHALVSDQPHPLLQLDLVSIKNNASSPESIDDQTAEAIDALGTLTISDTGNAKYFGRSAGSEALFFVSDVTEEEDGEAYESSSPIEPDILRLSRFFPINESGDWDTDRALELLYSKLPEQPRAWTLVETFLQHGAWTFTPMLRDEIVNDVLVAIYKLAKIKEGYLKVDIVSPHKLAVLFLILCLGTLMDLTIPPNSQDADVYLHCAKAALSLRPIFDSPEISTVQAVSYLAFYHFMSPKGYSIEVAWSLLSFAAKLAYGMGLHRDPEQWNLDKKTVQRRRFIFWEIYACQTTWSLSIGRPPAMRSSYVDCKFPEVDPLASNENPEMQVVRQWKWEFHRDIASLAIEDCLSAKSPSYKTIIAWDRKIREKSAPSQLTKYAVETDLTKPLAEVLRGNICNWIKATNLLYLHRPFFVQAMLDSPADPFQSTYAQSFIATYNCSSILMKSMINKYTHNPQMAYRWANTWSHLFSASAIAAMIVSRYPSFAMARTAFSELNEVVAFYQQYSSHVPRAKNGLMMLNKLRAKAQESFSKHLTGDPTKSLAAADDQIAIYGGQTRLLVTERLKQQVRTRKPREESMSTTISTPSTSSTMSYIPTPQSSDYSYQSSPQKSINTMMLPPAPDLDALHKEWASVHNAGPSSLPHSQLPVDFMNVPVPVDVFELPSNFAIIEDPAASQDWLWTSNQQPPTANDSLDQSAFAAGFTTKSDKDVNNQPSLVDWRFMPTTEDSMDTNEWMALMRETGFLDPPR